MLEEETQHFSRRVRPSRIGVGPGGTAARPRVARTVNIPVFGDRPPAGVGKDGAGYPNPAPAAARLPVAPSPVPPDLLALRSLLERLHLGPDGRGPIAGKARAQKVGPLVHCGNHAFTLLRRRVEVGARLQSAMRVEPPAPKVLVLVELLVSVFVVGATDG
jgi:hypothetical protein